LDPDLHEFDSQALSREIACAMSHAQVLSDIVKKGYTRCLILEDDIVIAGNPNTWGTRIAAAFEDLPEEWDMWYLFRCFDVKKRVRRLSPRTVVPYTPLSGSAYVVSLEGAKKLLSIVYPINKPIDRIYVEDAVQKGRVNVYAASPCLIVPGMHVSIINADNHKKKWVDNGVNRPPEFWPRKYRESQGHLFIYQPGKYLIGVADDAGAILRNIVVDNVISYLHGAILRHKRLSAFLFMVASIAAGVLLFNSRHS